MEQRRLRLGDILDDYCPRERRVTNHAVVAMIEEDVKQTRCTTCDAEHAYKGARVPSRRRKETPAALYKEVLDGMPETDGSSPAPAQDDADAVHAAVIQEDEQDDPLVTVNEASDGTADAPVAAAPVAAAAPRDDAPDDDRSQGADVESDGPVHRPLIRATLPRPDGQKDARPLPEFTIRQNNSRGNGPFRGDRLKMRGMPGATGNGGGRGRFQNSRPAGGGRRGPGGAGGAQPGFRSGQPRHGGKKGRGSRG